MRTSRLRWLTLLTAALLLVGGSVPAAASLAPDPAAAPAVAGAAPGRPAPDDVVRADGVNGAERGAVAERPALDAPPVVAQPRAAARTVAPAPSNLGASCACSATLRSRAPPAAPLPVLS